MSAPGSVRTVRPWMELCPAGSDRPRRRARSGSGHHRALGGVRDPELVRQLPRRRRQHRGCGAPAQHAPRIRRRRWVPRYRRGDPRCCAVGPAQRGLRRTARLPDARDSPSRVPRRQPGTRPRQRRAAHEPGAAQQRRDHRRAPRVGSTATKQQFARRCHRSSTPDTGGPTWQKHGAVRVPLRGSTTQTTQRLRRTT